MPLKVRIKRFKFRELRSLICFSDGLNPAVVEILLINRLGSRRLTCAIKAPTPLANPRRLIPSDALVNICYATRCKNKMHHVAIILGL